MALLNLTQTSSGSAFSLDENNVLKLYVKGSSNIVEYVDSSKGLKKQEEINEAIAEVFATAESMISTTISGATVYINAERVTTVDELNSLAIVRYDEGTEALATLSLGETKAAFEAKYSTTPSASLWESGTGSEAIKMKVANPLSANVSSGESSVAMGSETTASGDFSHAQNAENTASGNNSHAEGSGTTASGQSSHAEGGSTLASNSGSHAEGVSTTASGYAAHAEGVTCVASGDQSHAGGSGCTAAANESFAHGSRATVNGVRSAVIGGDLITLDEADTVAVPDFQIRKSHAIPTGAADVAGGVGSITWDADYIYVKTAAGAWKRAALTTF